MLLLLLTQCMQSTGHVSIATCTSSSNSVMLAPTAAAAEAWLPGQLTCITITFNCALTHEDVCSNQRWLHTLKPCQQQQQQQQQHYIQLIHYCSAILASFSEETGFY